jgi:hypothetical protein
MLYLAGKRKVLWHNMREEPVLYINGKPYVVREADQPFCNVEYTGIDRSRVEDMEVRLKRDVLREAQLYDGHVLVTEEDDDMQVGAGSRQADRGCKGVVRLQDLCYFHADRLWISRRGSCTLVPAVAAGKAGQTGG